MRTYLTHKRPTILITPEQDSIWLQLHETTWVKAHDWKQSPCELKIHRKWSYSTNIWVICFTTMKSKLIWRFRKSRRCGFPVEKFKGCDDGQVSRLLQRMGLMEGREVGGESGLPSKPFVAFTSVSNFIVLCNLIKVVQLVRKCPN